MEETGADTGVFVSKRAFQVGARESFAASEPEKHTHVVDLPNAAGATDDFMWGNFEYVDNGDLDGYADEREWLDYDPTFHEVQGPPLLDWTADVPSNVYSILSKDYIIGRFENMDTLIGMYQDPNDETDIAIAQMKIIDTEATISWDQEVYKDANGAATIIVVDPDENLNCNEVEAVPVFIIVNPGSWNPMDGVPASNEGRKSPTNFCMLLSSGGVNPQTPSQHVAAVYTEPIRWYNIYNSQNADHLYYIQYDPDQFATANDDGITAVLFYA